MIQSLLRAARGCRVSLAQLSRRTAQQQSQHHLPSLAVTGVRSLRCSPAVLETVPIRLPALSPTMTDGRIVQWNFKEGDRVDVGDVLFELETDKATMGVEATEEGYLAKILMGDDTSGIPINKIVGLLVEEEGEEPEMPSEDEPTKPDSSQQQDSGSDVEQRGLSDQQGQSQRDTPQAAEKSKPTSPSAPATNRPLSPAVRNLLAVHNLDASQIPATGPHGMLLKGDVLAYIEGKPSQAAQHDKPQQKQQSSSQQPSPSSAPPKAPPTQSAIGYHLLTPTGVRRRRRVRP